MHCFRRPVQVSILVAKRLKLDNAEVNMAILLAKLTFLVDKGCCLYTIERLRTIILSVTSVRPTYYDCVIDTFWGKSLRRQMPLCTNMLKPMVLHTPK